MRRTQYFTARIADQHSPQTLPSFASEVAHFVLDNVQTISVAWKHVMHEWHRPILCRDDVARLFLNVRDPIGELVRIGECCAEKHEPDFSREHNDRLLPHHPSGFVSHVVHFIKHYVFRLPQHFASSVKHIAQDFGREDDDGRVWRDAHVSSQQPDVPELLFELLVLLVRQGFDWRRVQRPAVLSLGHRDGILCDGGLACARVSSNEDVVAALEALHGLPLERVELELVFPRRLVVPIRLLIPARALFVPPRRETGVVVEALVREVSRRNAFGEARRS
mmetsp:Transcript_14564/g.35518  ORF Transcript_14564/g.35518 Transcript_14564/m.35518 type:complete len:278 (+) Transcript_14564:2129-2962(+)